VVRRFHVFYLKAAARGGGKSLKGEGYAYGISFL